MLTFWYSERCNRQIKLFICISTCVLIFLCAEQKQLDPRFAGFSLAIGMMIDLLYKLRQDKLKTLSPSLKCGLASLPILCLVCLIYFLPNEQRWILALQCVGFAAIGLFIVSIYSQRAKRFED
ncbi:MULTISPECIES: hypothetical protein [unclassified Acinetobacter]|uniref:hypothetical protein n=1 Tax=unclassified Acinetobacter TaxID=196816 RepID=UPI0015D39B4B|nr:MULTISPECIES: hypothetical protein [unclassified Acinetobacter]